VVPTSVKDANGRFIYDLKQEDFSVFEDGRRQEIQQFSIDPAPLSAVLLIDTSIGGTALRRFSAAITAVSYVDTRMLNDAVFAGMRDLEKRPVEYRKIMIAVSDGQDAKGIFQAQDILPRLVRDQIQFYAVTVRVPVMDRVTSTLAGYANATGGD